MRARSHRILLPVAVLLVAAVLAGLWTYAPWRPTRTILVAGDSLVVAASSDLTQQSSSKAHVSVLGGLGASPCDFLDGGPGGSLPSLRSALARSHPAAVVIAFSGNPGVSSHPCITHPLAAYTLDDLVAAYRTAVRDMGVLASRFGARVYLSAAPARNPGIPEGWSGGVQYGYNGDPALNSMLQALAQVEGWTYDPDAADALSAQGMGWSLYLPCLPEDGPSCVDGRVQVRVGGSDAIHCDAPGTNGTGSPSAGSLRFAHGLVSRPLADLGVAPFVASGLRSC